MWGVCHFFTKSVAMATFLEISKKRGPDHLHPKRFHSMKRLQKIGPADPEIIVLRESIKKEKKKKLTQAYIYRPLYIALLASLPSRLNYASVLYHFRVIVSFSLKAVDLNPFILHLSHS